MLTCSDIGISGCDYITAGTKADALPDMLDHLHGTHGFHLRLEDVRDGNFDHLDEPERMIAARLHRRVEEQRLPAG